MSLLGCEICVGFYSVNSPPHISAVKKQTLVLESLPNGIVFLEIHARLFLFLVGGYRESDTEFFFLLDSGYTVSTAVDVLIDSGVEEENIIILTLFATYNGTVC